MRRNRILRVTLLLATAFLADCVTPVIPLPPPKIEDVSFEIQQGTGTQGSAVLLTGKANFNLSGAWVFVVNGNRGSGVMTQAKEDGSFAASPLLAEDQDKIYLWAAPSYLDATGDVACGILDFASKKALRCNQR